MAMKLPTDGVIWFNGELVPWQQAQVHVSAHALHYGSAVFEGIRAYPTPKGPAVMQLAAHVRRLIESSRIVNMPVKWGEAEFSDAILATVRENGFESSYIRPLVFRGYGQLGIDPSACRVEAAIIVIEHGAHFGADAVEKGIEVGVSSWRRVAPDTLPAMSKSSANYLNSQLVMLEAKANGFTDGIVLDHEGFVSEGSGANLFAVVHGQILTPGIGSSILQGVTRRCVMDLARDAGLEVLETRMPREMLYIADEVFFSGTAAEITPIRSIDRITIGSGKRGPVAEALQEEFFGIINGTRPDRGWLTPVHASQTAGVKS